MNIIAGLDIGNGYVKGKLSVNDNIFTIDLPSTVAYIATHKIDQMVTDTYMTDLVNKLDVTINSRIIKTIDEGRVLVGRRAIVSGASLREFNIDDHTVKCQDALSTILILSSISSVALQQYYKENKNLDLKKLDVDCSLAVALPIEDYMQYKDLYKSNLMRDTHTVIVHNFDHDIVVNISFTHVATLAEGAAGQYAISNMGAKFLQLALDDARANGCKLSNEYTGQMLASATNTIGIDIGEGTVNFPVFANGSINIESSRSINKGYGTVLSNVVTNIRGTAYSFDSRKDLADFMMLDNLMPSQKFVQKHVQKILDDEIVVFTRDIIKEFSSIFRKIGARTDVIYVYGGGASPVRKTLYPQLIEAVKLDDNNSVPVIYLDSAYSRDLNRSGLFNIAKMSLSAS